MNYTGITGLSGMSFSSTQIVVSSTNQYMVRGFSDANYFYGPDNTGPSSIGTLRLIGKVISVPPSTPTQKVIVGRLSNLGLGFSLRTGASQNGLQCAQGPEVFTDAMSIVAGDIGSYLLVHQVFDGTTLCMYIGGMLYSYASASSSDPGVSSGLWIGRFQHGTGLAASEWGIVDVSFSSSAMTPSSVYGDAISIHGSTLIANDLPSQTYRFNANDLSQDSSSWVSRTGSLTLTRAGSLTVEAM